MGTSRNILTTNVNPSAPSGNHFICSQKFHCHQLPTVRRAQEHEQKLKQNTIFCSLQVCLTFEPSVSSIIRLSEVVLQ